MILHSVQCVVETGSSNGRKGQCQLRVCSGYEPYERLAESVVQLKVMFDLKS